MSIFFTNRLADIHQTMVFLKQLWKELSEEDIKFESLEWHKTTLAETEERMLREKDRVLDLEEAKNQ